jgi:hypothetical protein
VAQVDQHVFHQFAIFSSFDWIVGCQGDLSLAKTQFPGDFGELYRIIDRRVKVKNGNVLNTKNVLEHVEKKHRKRTVTIFAL